jgi:hypothetical protein
MSNEALASKAAETRREYKRRWNAEHRDKVKEHTRRYWERKALQEQGQEVQVNDAAANNNK